MLLLNPGTGCKSLVEMNGQMVVIHSMHPHEPQDGAVLWIMSPWVPLSRV